MEYCLKLRTILLGLTFLVSSLNINNTFGIPIFSILVGLLCIVVLFNKIFSCNNLELVINKKVLVALTLIFISWISVFWSEIPEISIQRLYSYTILPLFYIFAISVKYTNKDLKLIDSFIIITSVCYLLYVVIFQGLSQIMSGRFATTSGFDQNATAAVLYLLIIVITKTAKNILKKRICIEVVLLLLLALLVILLFLMTGSRGGLIALVILFFSCFMGEEKVNWSKYVIKSLLFVSAIFFVSYFLLPNDIFIRLFTLDSYEATIYSSKNRIAIWMACYEYLIPDMNFWGYGAGVPPYLIGSDFGMEYRSIHNTYLCMFLEFGVLMLPVFLLFLGLIAKKLHDSCDYISFGGLLGMCIIIFFFG